MAIRKPTAPSERSSAMAEMLAQAGQESTFKPGSLVEGTVSAIKDDDVYIDIGYKSTGCVDASEFVSANVTDKDVVFKPAEVKIAVDAKRLISEKFEVAVDGSCKAGPYGYIAVEF